MHTEPSALKIVISEYRATKATTTFVLDFLNRFLRLTTCTEKHVWFYHIQTIWLESRTWAAELLTYSYILFAVLDNFQICHSYI
jgi:hypothetical protein